MAVAHDAVSESHTNSIGSVGEASYTWEHDPVGVPAAVWVIPLILGSSADIVTSVTYEGVALTAVAGGLAVDAAGEPGNAKLYFLGAGVPTADTATVVVNKTATGTSWAVCATQTALGDCEVTGIVLLQADGTLAQQNVDDGSPGTNSIRYAAGYTGLAAAPAAGANSTAMVDFLLGARSGISVRETTAGQGSRPVGFSSGTSDDRAIVHFAVREIVVAFSHLPMFGSRRPEKSLIPFDSRPD